MRTRRARADKIARVPRRIPLPWIVLIKKRGTTVMKNPPLWRIIRISRFSIVRLWHGPLARDIYSRYYERVCFRARNKESRIQILRFNSFSNIAMRYTTMLRLCCSFAWACFWTHNKEIYILFLSLSFSLVIAALDLLLIFRNCRPIVFVYKGSGPGGSYVVLDSHLMDSFVERERRVYCLRK